jgi:hypothetical protein
MLNLKKEIARKGLFKILPSDKVLDDRTILYRAIIDRFLLDTVHDDVLLSDEAKKWFSLDNKIFFEVCDYADLDYDFAIQYIKKAHKMLKEEKECLKKNPQEE